METEKRETPKNQRQFVLSKSLKERIKAAKKAIKKEEKQNGNI
jgi:hypothetical protein